MKKILATLTLLSFCSLSANDSFERIFVYSKHYLSTKMAKTVDTIEKDKKIATPKKDTGKWIYGKASYYAGKFIGRRTASGEIFSSLEYTCAHLTYKFGTRLLVTNIRNGKSIIVRVNDRGGFAKYGRIIDLSMAAFKEIAHTGIGVINVKIQKL